MISLRDINEDNFSAIIKMKRPDGEGFVASNAYSLAQAWLYRENGDVFPFAIYNDEEVVGFLMLDEYIDERKLLVWRVMFPEEHTGKGYGSKALEIVINNAIESGKFDYVEISAVDTNERAYHVYTKLGFADTGELDGNEKVLRYYFKK